MLALIRRGFGVLPWMIYGVGYGVAISLLTQLLLFFVCKEVKLRYIDFGVMC